LVTEAESTNNMPKVVAQKFPARGRAVEMGGKNLEKNPQQFKF